MKGTVAFVIFDEDGMTLEDVAEYIEGHRKELFMEAAGKMEYTDFGSKRYHIVMPKDVYDIGKKEGVFCGLK